MRHYNRKDEKDKGTRRYFSARFAHPSIFALRTITWKYPVTTPAPVRHRRRQSAVMTTAEVCLLSIRLLFCFSPTLQKAAQAALHSSLLSLLGQ